MYYILSVFEHSMEQFRAALREQLKRPEEPLDALHSALISLASAVREGGTLAEQFVIVVKQELETAVYEHLEGDLGHHQRLRQALVTAAIKAYYLQ